MSNILWFKSLEIGCVKDFANSAEVEKYLNDPIHTDPIPARTANELLLMMRSIKKAGQISLIFQYR
jgi:hypothetical protein